MIIPNSNFQKAQTFLLNKESWIRRKLESRQKTIFYNPDSLVIFGIEYPIKYADNTKQKIKLSNSTIIACSTIENRTKALREFLIDLLLLKIKEIMSYVRSQKNLRFTEIKISNNKSIWGSSSSKGVLSFSWRLIFVPLEVLYYVIVHEMCHLLKMTHSPRF